MVDVSVVKQKLQDYIINQIDILGESNPAIKLVKPLAKRAIINNIDSFDKFINTIAKDGGTDIVSVHPFSSFMESTCIFTDYQRRLGMGRWYDLGRG